MIPWSKRSEQIAFPEYTTGRTEASPTEKCSKQVKWECPSCSPDFKLKMPRFHSGAARDRPETNEIPKLLPIPEVVWQQPTETITDQANINNTNNDSTSKTTVQAKRRYPRELNHRTT